MEDSPKNIKYIGKKTDDFKTTFVDGAFTWLQSETGTITFFYDNFGDEMVNSKGDFDISEIKRIFPIEIRMRRSTYMNLINFMTEQVKLLEDIEKSASNKKQ